MVWGADDLLNRLSGNSNEVTVTFSSRKMKDADDCLLRVSKMSELKNEDGSDVGYNHLDGAVYEVEDNPIKNNIITDNNLWLCGVTLFVFMRYPKKIYFKVVQTN